MTNRIEDALRALERDLRNFDSHHGIQGFADDVAAILRQIEAAPSPADSSQGEPDDFGTLNKLCRKAFEIEDGYGDPDSNPKNFRVFRDGFFASYHMCGTPPPSSPQVAVAESGPWKAGHTTSNADRITHASTHYIDSDDFTHDARLYITGDFGDWVKKTAYANEIARRLNAAPQSAPKAADDEPLFTASMYGTSAAADKAREEWLAAKGEPQWQPISSAPKDGSAFLGFGIHDHSPHDAQRGVKPGDSWTAIILYDVYREVGMGGSQFVFAKDGARTWSNPDYWMPMPAPPQQRARSLAQAERAK